MFSRRTGSKDFLRGFEAMRVVIMAFSLAIRGLREVGLAPAERRRDWTYAVGAFSSSSLSSI